MSFKKEGKKKLWRSIFICSLLSSQLIGGQATWGYAKEEQEVSDTQRNQLKEEDTSMSLIGYYYFGSDFKKPALINVDTFSKGKLHYDKETSLIDLDAPKNHIQSARWVGQITIDEKNEYAFTTSQNEHLIMKIGEQEVINHGQVTKIVLDKGTYDIQIEYNNSHYTEDIFNIDLSWASTSEKQQRTIPKNLILPPELEAENREIKLIPEKKLLHEKKMNDTSDNYANDYIDTDDDGIYDNWEINGYTAIGRTVYSWEEKYAQEGYTKFISNPYHAHTSGDPYSDFEKVTGRVDEAMSWESRNPMVASVPVISVGMERIILSKNISVGGETGGSESRQASSSSTWSNTEEIDGTVSASLNPFKLFSVSVTGKYTHSESQSISDTNTTGRSWSKSINLNKGETADLNANIRYYNTGTGVVYNLAPTVNLVLENDTVATITAQANEIANYLSPNEAYPERRLNALALNTLDQFSSRLIPLNYEQVEKLDKKVPLRLESTQFAGDFVKRSTTGGNIIGGSWDLYIPQIKKKTATITLDTGNNEAIERSIAAKDPKNINDKTPQLTLKEAIEVAFDAQYDEVKKVLHYTDSQTGKTYTIGSTLSSIIVDEKTAKEFQAQHAENNNINLLDVVIKPEMAIQIVPEETAELDLFRLIYHPGDFSTGFVYFSLNPYLLNLFNFRITSTDIASSNESELAYFSRDQITNIIQGDPEDYYVMDYNKPIWEVTSFPKIKEGIIARMYVVSPDKKSQRLLHESTLIPW